MFAHIRKLVVAVVGLAIVFLYNRFGVDLAGLEPAIIEGVLMVLTAVGIYAVPNDAPPKASP